MIIEKQENRCRRVADIGRDPKRGGKFIISQVFYGYTNGGGVARCMEGMEAKGFYPDL